MSGTSQCATSEPNIAPSRAPNGLTLVLNAALLSGSSASQPKKKRGTNCVDDVFGALDPTRRELVELRRILARTRDTHRLRTRGERAAVLRHQLEEQRLVDAGRIEVFQRAADCASPSAR